MTTDQKIEEMIRSYRFTVTVLSVLIVCIFALSLGLVWFGLPSMIAQTTKPIIHNEVRAAFDENLDIN